MPLKIILIGGGLSSLTLANGLQNSGIPFTLYERDTRHSAREGYQIRLGAPALTGFRACLRPADLEAIVSKFGRANGRKAAAPLILDGNWNTLLDLTSFKGYEKSAAVSRVVLRDALLRPLEEAGADLRFEKKVVGVDVVATDAGEKVRVHFEDGSSDEADIVIGADGNRSVVNEAVGLQNIDTLKTHWATISKASLSLDVARSLPAKVFEGPVLMFHNGLSLYFSAYLPDDQSIDTLTTTSDAKAPKFDESLATCMFGLFIPRNQCPTDFPNLPAQEKVSFLKSCMRGLAPEYTRLVDAISSADPYIYTPRASTRVPPTWRSNLSPKSTANPTTKANPRIWLIGDAAHAMLPYRGMGGNQSLQDCASILPHLQSLASYASSTSSLPKSTIASKLKVYEEEMIPRAFAWVEKSGGQNIMPFDSSSLWVRAGFAVLVRPVFAVYVLLWEGWGKIVGHGEVIDDAPEFQ